LGCDNYMSILFTPIKIGSLELTNRFVKSATYEGLSLKTGEMTSKSVEYYTKLAKGGIGLIITGHSYVHPLGKSMEYQNGIHSDNMIPSISKVVKTVHEHGGKFCMQITHGGLQCGKDVNKKMIAPSRVRSKITFVKPSIMTEDLINQTIDDFVDAANRAILADVDAIQIHAAHGYLVNEFLSPFFNHRGDEWGGTDENRFRFLKEIVLKIKKILPNDKALIIKLSSNDYTKKPGITPDLAVLYSKWLKDIGADAIEVSCGATHFSNMNVWRGDLPLEEIVLSFPKSQRFFVRMVLKKMEGKYGFDKEYNLDASKKIKNETKELPIILVGGARKLSNMETIIESGSADLISMCRPFIKEPDLVNKFNNGISIESECNSCNKCMAGAVWYVPTKCYEDGLPIKKV